MFFFSLYFFILLIPDVKFELAISNSGIAIYMFLNLFLLKLCG